MIGFCTRCKEYRGDYCEFGISMDKGFPECKKCGAYVDIIGGCDDC